MNITELETNFKFVLKDPEQYNVQEVMKEGTCRINKVQI